MVWVCHIRIWPTLGGMNGLLLTRHRCSEGVSLILTKSVACRQFPELFGTIDCRGGQLHFWDAADDMRDINMQMVRAAAAGSICVLLLQLAEGVCCCSWQGCVLQKAVGLYFSRLMVLLQLAEGVWCFSRLRACAAVCCSRPRVCATAG